MESVRLLLCDLPRNDALEALRDLTDWIGSIRENRHFPLQELFVMLRLLDEAAHPFEHRLMREYFTASQLTTAQRLHKDLIWAALNAFFLQVAQAYLNVQMRYISGDMENSDIQMLMPLIAARGIYALKGRLKCVVANYAEPEGSRWWCLAKFYGYAEEQGYLDDPAMLYHCSASLTSVRQEFINVMMWYASGASALNPLHVHLAERLTSHFSRYFTVSLQREDDSVFCFDLWHPESPKRVSAVVTPMQSMRFIGVGSARPHVEALLGMLEKNVVPKEIDLGGVFEADMVLDVLHHLSKFWVALPPVRQYTRHKDVAKLHVATGLAGLMRQIEPSWDQYGGTWELWVVENYSISGIGCILPPEQAEWAEIGALVAARPEQGTQWGACIIRRLRRDKENNLHAGMEVLGNHVTAVKLHNVEIRPGQCVLWLNSHSDDGSEIRLLMSPGIFSSAHSLYAELDGRIFLLMPLELLERGIDYDLARYRKIEEDESE